MEKEEQLGQTGSPEAGAGPGASVDPEVISIFQPLAIPVIITEQFMKSF